MYVGPSISGVGIQNTVYTKIPETAAEMIGKDPILSNLFVGVREYPQAEKEIRSGNGCICSAYKKALEIKNGGK